MKVTIQCVKLVKPKTPTPPHLRRYSLSLLDQHQVPAHIPAVFFYHADGGDSTEKVKDKLFRLEESLTEALVVHYPLAGCYVADGCFIDCNDKGVEFIVGSVNGHLDEILEKDLDRPGLDFIELIKKNPDYGEHISLIVAQVYVFECGALAISLSFSHKVTDFSSAITFFKGWATISRCGFVDEASCPSFVVPSIFPPKECTSVQEWCPPISDSEKLVMNRFVLDGMTLAQLKLAISSVLKVDASSINNRLPSRVEIALGLVWKALVKVDRWKDNGNLRPLAFRTSMNLRGKAGVSTSKNTFGNLVIDAYGKVSKEDRDMELHGFVKKVQQIIKTARSKYSSINNADEFRAMVEEDLGNIARIQGSSEDYLVMSTSWCGFGLYEIDFGFGKPELVMTPGPPFRQVILIDGRVDNGGIDALVILDEVEMAQFKKFIMEYLPKRHG